MDQKTAGTRGIRAAVKVCIALLVALIFLLAASYLPIGGKQQKQQPVYSLGQFGQFGDANDKISRVVKDQVAQSLLERREKLTVIVKSAAAADASRDIKKSKGRIKEVADVGNMRFAEVEMPVEKIVGLAGRESVARIYPVYAYYPVLAESAPLINAQAFWNENFKGSGIKVATLDTGIDKSHPMLSGKVVTENDFTDSGNANDNNGHGTHVAGIVAGATANGGLYSGVAPEAQLLNAKVIGDDGTGTTTDLIAGIGWSIQNGANVISMSLGAPTQLDEALEEAMKQAVSNGVVVVASSGNCGNGCPSNKCGSFRGVTSPGSSPSAISVGAVDKSRQVACFSSGENIPGVGIKPDVVAPGVDITSSVPNSGYEAKSGTSMSAPHVSGAVALLLQKNPGLTPADVKRILEETSVDLGAFGKDTSYGSGMLDLSNALDFYSELEFSVTLGKQMIQGNVQHVEVLIFDDIPILEVTGSVKKPDSAESGFAFSKADTNRYYYDYSDTSGPGGYTLGITIKYQKSLPGSDETNVPETGTAFFTDEFMVMLPTGYFGNLEAVAVPNEQFLSKNLTGEVVFASNAPAELNITMLLQLLQLLNGSEGLEESVAQEIRLPVASVAPGQTLTVPVNSPLEALPGNYTLRILTDYGAGSIANETNVTVIDDLAPELLGIDYSPNISANNPLPIILSLNEHSLRNLSISVYAEPGEPGPLLPLPVNYTARTLSTVSNVGNEKQLKAALTIFGGLQAGYGHKASIKACDEAGNCADSDSLNFNVTGCDGKQLLVVKDYGEKSVFEDAASDGSDVCLSVLDKGISGAPPSPYLGKFDAVVWSAGTDSANIDGEDAAGLIDYYGKKGRVVVEGSDVAFRHVDDDLMLSVLHARLKNDLGFSIESDDFRSRLGMNISRAHPIVQGLQSQLAFNTTTDPFPDSVTAYNRSAELAAWSSPDSEGAEGSAIVAYEDEGKSALLSFSIAALDAEAGNALAASLLSWLLDDSALDIKPGKLEHGFLAEGNVTATFIVESTEELANEPEVSVLVDGEEKTAYLADKLDFSRAYNFTAELGAGAHTVRVTANSDFGIKESNYVNNMAEYELVVYQREPDLLVSGLAYSYNDTLRAIILHINVSNLGGTPTASSVRAYLSNAEDAKQAEQGFELAPGETKPLAFEMESGKGVYDFKATADPSNIILEHNETNNELGEKLYICSKERVLVVDNNDAEFYSTSEPGSAGYFVDILKNDGYCAELWDKENYGTLPLDYASNFPVIILGTGNYFGNITSEEDKALLGNYSQNLLVEGSDVAMASADDSFFEALTGSVFSRDMTINTTELVLSSHPIADGVVPITIAKEKSPYPDRVKAVSSNVVAEWPGFPDGEAAITAKNDSDRKVAYYGFSVSGIADDAARRALVLSTVKWLLRKPNLPPLAPMLNITGEIVQGGAIITMNEGETKNFSVIAVDPDNDTLTYTWLLNGTIVSTTQNFSFSPKYNESGSYNLTIIVSDGKAEGRAEFTIMVLDTMDCDPGKHQRLCQLQLGVCSGSTETCDNNGKWLGCKAEDYFNYNEKYEVDESSCDSLDNDCDGEVDSNRVCNTAPQLQAIGNRTVSENSTLAFIVTASDNENDTLVYNATKLPEGASFDNAIAEFTWTPNFDQAGLYAGTFNVSDGLLSGYEEINITVANTNRKPVITGVEGNLTVNETENVTIVVAATDPDGNELNYSVNDTRFSQDTDATLGNMLRWETGYDDAGIYKFLATASDGQVNTSLEVVVVVNNVNRAPQILAIVTDSEDMSVDEGESRQFALIANDADLDSLNYSWSLDGAEVSSSTTYTFLPSYEDSGDRIIAVYVTDGELSDEQELNMTVENVNRPPELGSIADVAANESEEAIIAQSATDADNENNATNDDNTLTYSINDTRFVQDGGAFSWQTSFDDAGEYDVLVAVSDGFLSDTDALTVTVVNVNRAPVLEQAGNKTVKENQTLTVQIAAADPDNDNLTYSTNAEEALPSQSKFSFDPATGLFEWAPTFDDEGNYTVTFNVTDQKLSDAETISISVGKTNRAPILAYVPYAAVKESETLIIRPNATDPDNDAIFFSINDTKFTESNGTFAWTTDFDDAGMYKFTLTASDAEANASVAFIVMVNNVNRAPVITFASPDSYFIIRLREGEPQRFAVEAKDPDNDALSYTWKVDGEEVASAKASYTYTPSYADAGEHVIAASVSDGGLNRTHEFNVEVTDVNRAPIIESISPGAEVTMDEGASQFFEVAASDPDNDELSYIWKLDGEEVSTATGYTYSPDYDDSGQHSLTITVSDGKLHAEGSVTVNVNDALECADGKIRQCPPGGKGVCYPDAETCVGGHWAGCPEDSYGDINSDGEITLADTEIISGYLVGKERLDAEQMRNADVSNDSKVTVVDALLVAQYASGSRDTFPVCP